MARNPLIRDGDSEACNTEIKETLNSIGSKLGNVGRVDVAGKFRCSLNPALIGTEASKLGSYITDIFNDPEHKPVMSDPLIIPNVEGYVVAVHVPVWTTEGKFDGTLGGAIYLQNFKEKYLQGIAPTERSYIGLLEDGGTILYHNKKEYMGSNVYSSSSEFRKNIVDPGVVPKILSDAKDGQGGVIRHQRVREGEVVTAYEPIPVFSGKNWIITITVPVSEAKEKLASLGVDSLLSTIWKIIAAIVILTVIGFILASRELIFKPINKIQEMKTNFVSLVSHQLKTPVAQIKGFAENMLDGLTGRVTKKQKEYLRDMIMVANKNSKLIDDLLDVSRLERGMLKVNIETFSLTEMLRDVTNPLRAVASTKGVILTENIPESEIKISGDSIKIREALRNIVDNAIKFTPAGKKVSVSVEDKIDVAVVTIADEGEGVDPDVQKELFAKNRVWSGKVKASGAGLGLFLSKNFIELSGGSVAYKTAKDIGTTFGVTFKKG